MTYLTETFIPYTKVLTPLLLEGLWITIYVSALAFLLSIILGAILAIIQHFRVKILSQLAKVYVSYFRGTPLLIQLFLFYYGLPMVFDVMKRCPKTFALVLCLAMVPISAFAEQKTTIRTVDQLLQFAKAVDNGEYDDKTDAVVSLEADLDLKDVKTWTPIGSADNDANVPHFFSGKFYGNGHTISNLDFSDAYGMIEYESYGFFGYIENAEISGLTVQGSVNATGSRKYSDFGSIVGASIKSTIRDCVSDISFTNSDNYLYGSIGLCGFAMDSTFEHCQSKGSISVTRTDNDGASLNVGGIVGYAGGTSEIRYCFNTADIEVRANSIGGIAGSLGSGNPSITNCYSIGKLTVLGKPSGGNTGGIVGYIYGAPPIKSCYFAGEIDLTNYGVTTLPYSRLGGLVGKVESGTPVFENSYYTETENVASCGTSAFAADTAESIDSMKTQEFYDKLTQNGGDYRSNPNGTPLLPGPKYTVTFTVSPAELTNVVITANGQALTNGSIDLEAGTYPVTVVADNCEPFSVDITITADTATHAQTLTLTYKPADYTAVDAAIDKAGALNRDDYTDFSAVDAAINAVDRSKNITQQAAVDAMAKAIETALDALVVKPTATPAPTEAPTPAPAAPAATAQPTAAPTATPAPVVTATPQPPVTIPQTGDSMNVTLLFALTLCSGAALGLAAHKKNRS